MSPQMQVSGVLLLAAKNPLSGQANNEKGLVKSEESEHALTELLTHISIAGFMVCSESGAKTYTICRSHFGEAPAEASSMYRMWEGRQPACEMRRRLQEKQPCLLFRKGRQLHGEDACQWAPARLKWMLEILL